MKRKSNKQRQAPAASAKRRKVPAFFQGKKLWWASLALFFFFAWAWASWWMGDVFRIAYEHSFFATNATLMHFLLQQRFGWLWVVGRAVLTLYRWPLLGGLCVALMLTAMTWGLAQLLPKLSGKHFTFHILRFSLSLIPAFTWMWWTADVGLNLYYMHEPGRIFATPLLVAVVLGTWAGIKVLINRKNEADRINEANYGYLVYPLFTILCFTLPVLHLNNLHPFMRPLTRMQMQLLHNDYAGMSRTAHDHADIGNRQIAGYYAIALARTGHLADQLFDIKLEFDTIRAFNYKGKPIQCLNYHTIDCNYHAGLIRAARHTAIEVLTMDGPTLFTLKLLAKISLIEGDIEIARKYLHIISKAPFESDFVNKYAPMVKRPDLVAADPEFAAIIKALPPHHTIENFIERPCYLGYYARMRAFDDIEQLTWSTMACLYSKRMPDFLMRCQHFIGSTPPRYIAEGLVMQAPKHPEILKAFPQIEMDLDRYNYFLQAARPYKNETQHGAEVLYNQFHAYYPYYYYFGNQRSTRHPEDEEQQHKAGVN